jgi:hypothetical protein
LPESGPCHMGETVHMNWGKENHGTASVYYQT